MDSIIPLLEIPAVKRTQSNSEQIVGLLLTLKFFKDLQERQGNSDKISDISKILEVVHYKPGQYVFKTGDSADKYYFLLKGTVKILSKSYVEIDEPGDDEINKLIRENFEVTHLRNRKNKDSHPEAQMGILSPGNAFGEAAIINDKPRNFSVLANEHITVATLHKNDFFKLEGSQEKQINEKIEFLRTIEAFKTWSRVSLYNLTFYFKELKFIRGAIVYPEGDTPNVVYLIKEGEFKFTQRFTINAGSKHCTEQKNGRETSVPLSARNITIRTKDLQVVTKQQGEMFGFEEMHEKLPGRMFKCACISQTGKLLYISEKNFSKKVTHPESLKYIEEQCNIFREWTCPRLEELKKIEMFKNDNSYTPYQKIKLTPRSSSVVSTQQPRPYIEYISDYQPLPVILKKILTTKRTSTSQSRNKSRTVVSNFTMFQTELEDIDQGKYVDLNSTMQFNSSGRSYFVPTKLSRTRIKKIRTNLI